MLECRGRVQESLSLKKEAVLKSGGAAAEISLLPDGCRFNRLWHSYLLIIPIHKHFLEIIHNRKSNNAHLTVSSISPTSN